MENKEKTYIDKDVILDSHNGVVFFDDISCKIKKFHNKDFKNIYSVVVKYHVPTLNKDKIFRMDYGQFSLADHRFCIETSEGAIHPSCMDMKEVNLIVSTFKGNNLLYEDNIRKIEYDNIRIMPNSEQNDAGDEIYYSKIADGTVFRMYHLESKDGVDEG